MIQARIAQIVPCTEAEGPFQRMAIWFQGCPLRCAGCCNPEFLPFSGGELWSVEDLISLMLESQKKNQIEGISLLGGEPFAHAQAAVPIAREAQKNHLGVMVYSGYTLEQLQARPEPEIHELLAAIDLLVDGPYDRTLPETERRWIGSQNQRVHFLTPRYNPADPCWRLRNTLEIRVRGNEISVNGFPAQQALGLWKRPKTLKSEKRPRE